MVFQKHTVSETVWKKNARMKDNAENVTGF